MLSDETIERNNENLEKILPFIEDEKERNALEVFCKKYISVLRIDYYEKDYWGNDIGKKMSIETCNGYFPEQITYEMMKELIDLFGTILLSKKLYKKFIDNTINDYNGYTGTVWEDNKKIYIEPYIEVKKEDLEKFLNNIKHPTLANRVAFSAELTYRVNEKHDCRYESKSNLNFDSKWTLLENSVY